MDREFRNWLSLSINRKTLEVFFAKNCIKTIAIYGGGCSGDFFYSDVIKYGVDVKFCIDREITQFHSLPIIRPEQLINDPEVDLVVICVSDRIQVSNIYTLIFSKEYKAISLLDIIQICYYKEILIPYCKSIGCIPYILSQCHQDQLKDLSPFEKALSKISLPAEVSSRNPSYFEDLYNSISEYNDEYIREVFTLSPTIRKNHVLFQADKVSEFVNIINGIRFTDYVPAFYDETIHIIGPCTVLGYGVDDSRTISSYLQRLLNEQLDNNVKFRVVNHGALGLPSNDPDVFKKKLSAISIKEGDIVILIIDIFEIYNQCIIDCFTKVLNPYYYCLYDDFCNREENKPLYIDYVHLSHWGMDRVANYIFNLLKKNATILWPNRQVHEIANEQLKVKPPERFTLSKKDTLEEYISFLEPYRKDICFDNGAIVMNCNPFTKGHRHLIEVAAQQVDFLYIFVVEEDRSDFAFKDRINCVNLGTADFKNIIVLPSGKFILSAITFPEYFIKESLQAVSVDASKDIEIFSREIAPILNIKKRFVGQEPFDLITRQYNQTMKDILPKYNIELIEIERYSYDGNPISASRVRKLLKLNEWSELSKIVPETTLKYLSEKR